MGWWTDYPGADNNFSVRLGELTFVRVKMKPTASPTTSSCASTDPLLYHCPILYMEDVGTIRFSDEEVESLRSYLLKGGFLYVDDFWGTRRGSSGRTRSAACCRRTVSDRRHPARPRDHAHALRREGSAQVPSINRWYR
jgi:hypothetical protein